jgi:hypothetical protein
MGKKVLNTVASVGTVGLSDLAQGKSWGAGITDPLAELDPTKVGTASMNNVNQAIANTQAQQDAAQKLLAQQQAQVGLAQGTTDTSLNLLQAAAEGKAPSAAQGILQQGADQAIANQMAMANAGNMSNQIVRQRAAADQGANIQQQTANQAGMLRANEMANARSAFNQGASQNLGLGIGAQQGTQGLLGQLVGTQGNIAVGKAGIEQQAASQSAAGRMGLIGGLLNSVGGAAMNMAGGGAKPSAAPAAMSEGGVVEGKEVVKGDSEKNDIVPTLLSAGEIVIPKSATKDLKSAVSFLEKIMHERGEPKEEEESEHKEDSKETAKKLFEKKKG